MPLNYAIMSIDMWLPKWMYHCVPWFYFGAAGAFMIFGKGNLFFESVSVLLGCLGLYVVFMRFMYGNAGQK